MKKALLVEDCKVTVIALTFFLKREGYEVAEASSVEKAMESFSPDLDLVLVDGLVEDGPTVEMVRQFSEKFQKAEEGGRMIAISSDSKINEELVEAGCHASVSKKGRLPSEITERICQVMAQVSE